MNAQPMHSVVAERRTGAGRHDFPSEVDSSSTLRVDLPFPATVRGYDAGGERFTMDTVLHNLSARSLHMWLAQRVELGARLFVVVRLSTAAAEAPAPRVALRGTVVRVEDRADGRLGLAIEFSRHRFLYADQALTRKGSISTVAL